eukprot:761420-Hanusia_phi.AAC.3
MVSKTNAANERRRVASHREWREGHGGKCKRCRQVRKRRPNLKTLNERQGGISRGGAGKRGKYEEKEAGREGNMKRRRQEEREMGSGDWLTGGAYDVMASKHLRGDINLAWPNSEIAVMGAAGKGGRRGRSKAGDKGEGAEAGDIEQGAGAVNIIFRGLDATRTKAEVEKYERLFANPLTAARRGYIDAVIEPHTTRTRLCMELDALLHKQVGASSACAFPLDSFAHFDRSVVKPLEKARQHPALNAREEDEEAAQTSSGCMLGCRRVTMMMCRPEPPQEQSSWQDLRSSSSTFDPSGPRT